MREKWDYYAEYRMPGYIEPDTRKSMKKPSSQGIWLAGKPETTRVAQMQGIEAMVRLMRNADDAKVTAMAQADGHADGHAAGFSEGWEAGNDVATTGIAQQER